VLKVQVMEWCEVPCSTAYERNSKPGGQARVERLRLYEGVAMQRGDHKGESDDRMMYLRQSAELGDWRAMLAMANGRALPSFPSQLSASHFGRQTSHLNPLKDAHV